jgi:hypothetical protein
MLAQWFAGVKHAPVHIDRLLARLYGLGIAERDENQHVERVPHGWLAVRTSTYVERGTWRRRGLQGAVFPRGFPADPACRHPHGLAVGGLTPFE